MGIPPCCLHLGAAGSRRLTSETHEKEKRMGSEPALDQAKMDTFVHKVLGDTSATMTTTLAVLGDRLGLFKDLAAHGPATSDELASRMGINERYAREWL